MRISDWSSDVCSSDLRDCRAVVRQRSRYDPHLPPHPDLANSAQHPTRWREVGLNHVATTPPLQVPLGRLSQRIKTAHCSANPPTAGSLPADRKRVVSGKSVSVRVDPAGSRINKQKN